MGVYCIIMLWGGRERGGRASWVAVYCVLCCEGRRIRGCLVRQAGVQVSVAAVKCYIIT